MINIRAAEKLAGSTPTMVDPDAGQLLTELLEAVLKSEYKVFSSTMTKEDGSLVFREDNMHLLDFFVERFLNVFAYVGSKEADGVRLPSYDPFHIAYTESRTDNQFGPMKQWIGYYSNCFLLYSQWPEHGEKDAFLIAIDNETYEDFVKAKEVIDNGFGTES